MDILLKVAQLILSLSILVTIHELGHFFFARLFKIRVEKFYLFFDPWFSLFKKKIGNTTYGIGWLPLGGYVKIAGMIDESMDKDQLASEPKEWEFRSKPSWQRLLVMIGGVLFNFILAMVIYSTITWVWGKDYIDNSKIKYGYHFADYAKSMGFQDGDKITSIDDEPIVDFRDISKHLLLDNPKSVTVTRNGEQRTIPLAPSAIDTVLKYRATSFCTPRVRYLTVGGVSEGSIAEEQGILPGDRIIQINGQELAFQDFRSALNKVKGESTTIVIERDGKQLDKSFFLPEDSPLGVFFSSYPPSISSTMSYSFLEAIPYGISHGTNVLSDYIKQIKLLFVIEDGAQQLGGFGTIANIFPSAWDWRSFWGITAFLSIMLGVMNILPIPALDGGHVLFLLYEMITGRVPNEKFLTYAQIVGMVFLLGLVLFANINDVLRAFS